MATSTLEKIHLLLKKAENTDNEHEADAFFAKAQELATRESIDLEKARALPGNEEDKLVYKIISLGKKRTFGLNTHVILFNNIAVNNDVRCTVSDDSVYITAYGYERDINIVQTLYASLILQMHAASEKYLATGAYRSERIWREGYHEGGVWKPPGWRPMHGSTARISFKKAFAGRVGERLREARESTLRTSGTGAELVLVSKANRVNNYFSRFVDTRRTWQGGAGQTHSQNALQAGREAGNRASLGGSSIGGSRQELG